MNDLSQAAQAIFEGRSRNSWSDRPVPAELIRQLYDLVKLGPTSMNSSPARFRFVVSQEARNRLADCAMGPNQDKIRTAPCVVIIATDECFHERMPQLFPIREGVREMFAQNDGLRASTAFRNSTLQGAYLIVAARLLGLDCGPMSGFNPAALDEAFFAGTTLKTNFICAIGYANDTSFPRLPRLTFEEAAEII
jgi:3-hydroxypropanoate dehydrogenase